MPDEELAGYPVEQDLATALSRWNPEGVIVSNPTALHMEVAVPAAESGSHLLLEKPISHNMAMVEPLQKALQKNRAQALVGFQFRFHPGLREVKKLLDREAIGQPISARVVWGEYLPGWHPWEDYRNSYSARKDLGGGVVLTLSHPFDYLRWLFGEVISVRAEVRRSKSLDLAVEDTADALLGFERDMTAAVHLDYNQRPPVHWLEIVGSAGTLRWDNADGAVRWWSADLEEWMAITAPAGFERNAMFLAEMENFLAVVKGSASPVCTLTDGIKALEIALGVLQSAKEGIRVEIPKHSSWAEKGDKHAISGME
jgi:predicted dehydrogenase